MYQPEGYSNLIIVIQYLYISSSNVVSYFNYYMMRSVTIVLKKKRSNDIVLFNYANISKSDGSD